MTGGAVGAGMFALPIVSAGVGFIWASLGLLLVWFATYRVSLMLMQTNLEFSVGASFNTIVKAKLGPGWVMLNNFSIAFIMYVLMYAFTTAGASILDFTLGQFMAAETLPSRPYLSLIFTLAIALLIWAGSSSVSRISVLALAVMLAIFALVVANLFGMVKLSNLESSVSQLSYAGALLPVFVTAFACGGLVPSLLKHYSGDATRVAQCLRYGTLASLAIYLVWLVATLGVLSTTDLKTVIAQGGNMGDLVAGLSAAGAVDSLNMLLTVFSHLAITTSFLSVGLGLFDFVLDILQHHQPALRRVLATLICFVPPAAMSFVYPYGFVSAISYAGLAVCFSFFLVPALMRAKSGRSQGKAFMQIRPGVLGVLLFTFLVVGLKLLAIGELLPTFR